VARRGQSLSSALLEESDQGKFLLRIGLIGSLTIALVAGGQSLSLARQRK
jgi:hypothetical protein